MSVMKRASTVRVFALCATLTSAAGAVATFIGCGSDEDAAGNGPNGQGADVGRVDGGRVDAGTVGEGGALDDGGACTMTTTCDPDAAPCSCDLACFVTRCVAPAACDEALVSWVAPTQNSDGACLRDLGGFVLYSAVDASGGPYTNIVDASVELCVPTGTTTCGDAEAITQQTCGFRLTKLANGTWYFVMTAYNEAGVESAPTPEVSKVIACPKP